MANHERLDQKQQAIVFKEAIFLVVPKVANTSIKVALANWKGKKFEVGPHGPLVHHQGLFKYDFVQNLHKYKQQKIGFVRSPWSRLVSCYRNKVKKKGHFYAPLKAVGLTPNSSFEQFIAMIEKRWGKFNNHWAPCHLWADHADRVLRFETIQDEWKNLQDEFGLPDLPHENNTGAEALWESYYTPELLKKVERMYKTDVDTWYKGWWDFGL